MMKYNPPPMPVEELRAILGYDPETGLFWWKNNGGGCGGALRAGKRAGCLRRGYIIIKIRGVSYGAHRLAWYIVHGSWPPQEVDHRNLIGSDNRIDNLRPATGAQNRANRKMLGAASGYRGVTRSKNKWKARASIHGKETYIGLYNTPELAYTAVCDAIHAARGEFARTD